MDLGGDTAPRATDGLSAVFCRTGAMLMDANDRTVEEHLFKISVLGQSVEDVGPNAALLRAREPLVDGVLLAERVGKITPRCAGASKPENSLHKEPIFGPTPSRIRQLSK